MDEVFGPAFVKICAYFPYPIKIWLNGHEYAKRRAAAAGIAFTKLDNGLATTDDPAGWQGICDTLSAGVIRVFCERWWARLPLPLTEVDRVGGYWWDIATRQVEVSRTIVFDAPRHARGFFEALCTDNLDIGRPEQMQLVFARRVATAPVGGIAPGCYAAALLTRAQVLRATKEFGDDGDLMADLDAASVLATRTSALTYEPFIREERGRARGDQTELREALRLFAVIGATGHARRLEAELDESPIGPGVSQSSE